MVLVRSVLALLSLVQVAVSLLCLALDDVFLLVHGMRLHLSVSVFAIAHLALSVGVGLLRSRHVLLLLLLL